MELPKIVEAIKAQFKEKKYPCRVNRASSMGYFVPLLDGCVRRGVYARTNWQDAEEWGVDSLVRFEEGNRQERHVLKDMMDAGYDPVESQSGLEWPEFELSGHIDCCVIVDGVAIPVEIKSMSPMIYQNIFTLEDFDKYTWTRAYKAQITLYMLFKNIDWGIFLLKDKSSGLMKQINVSLDYELGEACCKTAEIINKHVKDGTQPERTDNRETCKKCPFKHICLPDIDFGVPLKLVDDPLFSDKLEKCLELKASAGTYKKSWDALKEEMKAQANAKDNPSKMLNMIVGNFHITADGNKAQFRAKIVPVGSAQDEDNSLNV